MENRYGVETEDSTKHVGIAEHRDSAEQANTVNSDF